MRRALVLAIAVVLPRVLVFPLNQNLYGDAVARTWLAEFWAESPHLIGSFAQGARQFGPLHLYLLALAEWLWPSPEHAGRALSLIVGCVGAWPLHALARRVSGDRGAVVAVLGYALWGMHVQCATTAASEALNLTLVLGAVASLANGLGDGPRAWRWLAALLLNLACATRYDSWLLLPLFGAVIWWPGRRWWRALEFGVLGSAFVVPWLVGHWLDFGDAFYPLRYIDDFHRQWFSSEAAIWGPVRYRLMAAGFWAGTALLTLGPPLAVAGMVGLVRAWRQRSDLRWLVLLILLPTALYTARAAVLGSFVPLARFTVKEVALLLPFAHLGAAPWLERLSGPARRWVLASAFAVTVAWPAWLGWYSATQETSWAVTLRPVSPVARNGPEVREVGDALHSRAAEGVLLVDTDPQGYDDLQVASASGFPFARLARARSPLFESRLTQGPWSCLVLFRGGDLEKSVEASGPGPITFRDVAFPVELATAGRMRALCRSP